MSFWSGIKYALNSSIGTQDFKPLDKYIESLISISPSSELIHESNEIETSTVDYAETILFSETMNLDGYFRVAGFVRSISSRQSGYYFIVRINGEDVINTYISSNTSNEEEEKTTHLVSFAKGDEIKVIAKSGRDTAYARSRIYGSVTLGKMFV